MPLEPESPKRLAKHICITQTIANLQAAVNELEDLYAQIVGQPRLNENKNPEETSINLAQFMDTTPQIINELTARIRDNTEVIRQAIF